MAPLAPLTIGDLKDIIGRALLDPAFRQQLTQNPETTLLSLGVAPTPEARRLIATLMTGTLSQAASLIDLDVMPRPPSLILK